MDKLIIEARVNENTRRERGNPNVPYTPDEIVADALECRKAGAAILHFHARKPDGAPDHATDTYAARSPADYRHYVVNHEVGHVFGNGHVDCPGAGQPAPVMVQQTLSLGGCVKNAWPFP